LKVIVNNDIGEVKLSTMQKILSKKNIVERAEIFIQEICNLNPTQYPETEHINAFTKWLESIVIPAIEPPYEFQLNGKLFKSSYLQFKGKKISALLEMQIAYLIEASNIEIDQEKFKGIDNIAALFYREDWSKDWDYIEYINNAILFENSKIKYSLYGLTKYNELILNLKNSYPILYQGAEEEEAKTDGRKMFDLLNAISQDNPINYKEARNVKISDAFIWMEEKKIQSTKQKLKK